MRRRAPALLARVGVVGVGVGAQDGADCIVVMIETEPADDLPDTLDGYPVRVEVTGRPTAG